MESLPQVDVLIITALKEEYEAARDVALKTRERVCGVTQWEKCDESSTAPYLLGTYVAQDGAQMTVALARPTRIGATATLPLASALVERLKPRCLAMCGVCAGNADDVALGDVIIVEMTYAYDEGKVKPDGFEGDHRQISMLDTWVRAAQELSPRGLPSFGPASGDEAKHWLLERLYAQEDPKKHPAFARYFPEATWSERVRLFIAEKLVRREGMAIKLTDKGRALVENLLFFNTQSPKQLPFEIKVGPMASGNVVVKDGLTWKKLAQWGVRSVLGLEMEAAAIGSLAHRLNVQAWVVAKGVMDHADPRKDDRYKPFACRASAEVLLRFLSQQLATRPPSCARVRRAFVIGGVTEETDHPAYEEPALKNLCTKLGGIIAAAGVDLIVCSPFPDSADTWTVMGYVESESGGNIHFHSPRHPLVAKNRAELAAALGDTETKIIDWDYPGPEDDESWEQAWLLCQLQALEHADIVIAIGGRVSNTANTLLHLAEARRIPLVPYAFLGGAARRAYERRDWERAHPGLDHKLLLSRQGISHAIEIANRLATDHLVLPDKDHGPPQTFFISRARLDSDYGDRLKMLLTERGLDPLLGDREIREGCMVQTSIDEAILRSDVFVSLWSRNYAQSMWCFDELDLAIDRRRLGNLQIWVFNLDGSDIVPRAARDLPQVVIRTPADLDEAVRDLLDRGKSGRR